MGVRQLILCGCVTDQCVAHAVMDACDLGYLVTLVPGEASTTAHVWWCRAGQAGQQIGVCGGLGCCNMTSKASSDHICACLNPDHLPLERSRTSTPTHSAECCATYGQDRHDAALRQVRGYCRMRSVEQLAQELAAASAVAVARAGTTGAGPGTGTGGPGAGGRWRAGYYQPGGPGSAGGAGAGPPQPGPQQQGTGPGPGAPSYQLAATAGGGGEPWGWKQMQVQDLHAAVAAAMGPSSGADGAGPTQAPQQQQGQQQQQQASQPVYNQPLSLAQRGSGLASEPAGAALLGLQAYDSNKTLDGAPEPHQQLQPPSQQQSQLHEARPWAGYGEVLGATLSGRQVGSLPEPMETDGPLQQRQQQVRRVDAIARVERLPQQSPQQQQQQQQQGMPPHVSSPSQQPVPQQQQQQAGPAGQQEGASGHARRLQPAAASTHAPHPEAHADAEEDPYLPLAPAKAMPSPLHGPNQQGPGQAAAEAEAEDALPNPFLRQGASSLEAALHGLGERALPAPQPRTRPQEHLGHHQHHHQRYSHQQQHRQQQDVSAQGGRPMEPNSQHAGPQPPYVHLHHQLHHRQQQEAEPYAEEGPLEELVQGGGYQSDGDSSDSYSSSNPRSETQRPSQVVSRGAAAGALHREASSSRMEVDGLESQGQSPPRAAAAAPGAWPAAEPAAPSQAKQQQQQQQAAQRKAPTGPSSQLPPRAPELQQHQQQEQQRHEAVVGAGAGGVEQEAMSPPPPMQQEQAQPYSPFSPLAFLGSPGLELPPCSPTSPAAAPAPAKLIPGAADQERRAGPGPRLQQEQQQQQPVLEVVVDGSHDGGQGRSPHSQSPQNTPAGDLEYSPPTSGQVQQGAGRQAGASGRDAAGGQGAQAGAGSRGHVELHWRPRGARNDNSHGSGHAPGGSGSAGMAGPGTAAGGQLMRLVSEVVVEDSGGTAPAVEGGRGGAGSGSAAAAAAAGNSHGSAQQPQPKPADPAHKQALQQLAQVLGSAAAQQQQGQQQQQQEGQQQHAPPAGVTGSSSAACHATTLLGGEGTTTGGNPPPLPGSAPHLAALSGGATGTGSAPSGAGPQGQGPNGHHHYSSQQLLHGPGAERPTTSGGGGTSWLSNSASGGTQATGAVSGVRSASRAPTHAPTTGRPGSMAGFGMGTASGGFIGAGLGPAFFGGPTTTAFRVADDGADGRNPNLKKKYFEYCKVGRAVGRGSAGCAGILLAHVDGATPRAPCTPSQTASANYVTHPSSSHLVTRIACSPPGSWSPTSCTPWSAGWVRAAGCWWPGRATPSWATRASCTASCACTTIRRTRLCAATRECVRFVRPPVPWRMPVPGWPLSQCSHPFLLTSLAVMVNSAGPASAPQPASTRPPRTTWSSSSP